MFENITKRILESKNIELVAVCFIIFSLLGGYAFILIYFKSLFVELDIIKITVLACVISMPLVVILSIITFLSIKKMEIQDDKDHKYDPDKIRQKDRDDLAVAIATGSIINGFLLYGLCVFKIVSNRF